MKKNKILSYSLALGLVILLGVLISLFFTTLFIGKDAQKMNKTPVQKISGERQTSKVERPPPPRRIESTVSGKIISIEAKKSDEDEIVFILSDDALGKNFKIRLSNRAQIYTRSFDPVKDVITAASVHGENRFSHIKVGGLATIMTIDPIDSPVPLQALHASFNIPPSKKQ